MDSTPEERTRSVRGNARDVSLLFVLLVGAAVLRVAALEFTFPAQLFGDELYYVDTAAHIANGDGHYSALRRAWAAAPPAHPWLLSHLIDADRPPVNFALRTPRRSDAWRYVDIERGKALLYAQVGLGVLLVALTALLAWQLFDRRTALVAGSAAALYPTFIAYSHYLWSTVLFSVLLAGALLAAARGVRAGSWPLAAAAGLAFGLAALTRETALPIALGCAIWWWRVTPPPRRRGAGQAALLLAVALLVVTPWAARNTLRFERALPVSTIGWMALREGNTLGSRDWLRPDPQAILTFHQRYFAVANEIDRMELAREEAFDLIRREQPTWLAKKVVRNLALLLAPDSYFLQKLDRGSYGHLAPEVFRPLVALTILAYVLVVTFAVVGVAAARGRGRRSLVVAVAGILLLVHVVANASSRYRLPLMPLLIAYASHGFLSWRGAGLDLSRREAAVAGVILAFFFGVGVLYFGADAASLWRSGTYAGPAGP